ncbi:MAG: lycopene cyclase domain-containing protein [Ignavibacteria bacterium]|nr:lycopene cyclase domain-containing protein [Ignavibacteria bacterium]
MKSEYFLVLLVSILFPFILSFSRKINFYRKPIRLAAALIIPATIFIIWDVLATKAGHWSFNEKYVTGLFIFNLPLEEILFFFVIPFCSLFLWESVKFFKKQKK